MLTPVASSRARVLRLPLEAVEPNPERVAVLLNSNARKVNDRLAERIGHMVGREHVFYSHNLDEAEALTREIVQRGYGTVLSGGGDGTLCRTVNLVQRYVEEANAWRIDRYHRFGERQHLLRAPRFGFLRLGTGNGMSHVVGASDPLLDVQRLVDFGPGRTHTIDLIESGGERFFFGGMGYDSLLLNDYNALKAQTRNPLLRSWMHGVAGYFAAMFMRTLPRALFGNTLIDAHVVTKGRAFYMDARRGDAAIEIEPGSTLFEGKTRMLGAGTVPFFGYGFTAFPFASMRPGMMHLRIADLGPLRTLANLNSVWRGNYRSPGQLFDFLVEDVAIELRQPYPFQHSGDAQGLRNKLSFTMAPEPLRLVDFHKPALAS